MTNRYIRLFTIPENQYSIGSPLLIVAGALLKDNFTGKILAQIKLKNISQKTIKLVKLLVQPLDSINKPLGKAVEMQYLDLEAVRDSEFGQREPILLPDNTTRAIEVIVTEVYFADNSTWTMPTEATWFSLPKLNPREHFKSELEKQFRMTYGQDYAYVPERIEDLWYCACGAINKENEAYCHFCSRDYLEFSSIDIAALEVAKEDRLREEQAAAEAAKRERRKKEKEAEIASIARAKRKKKIGLIGGISVIIIAAIVMLVTKFIIPNAQYKEALALTENKDYDTAYTYFISLGKFKDSESLAKEALQLKDYDKSLEFIENEEYDLADSLLVGLGDFKDSETLLLENRYAKALSLLELKAHDEAYIILSELGDYKDSSTLILDNKYDRALEFIENEKYDLADSLLIGLGDFKDSETLLLENKHAKALSLLELKVYDDAYTILSELGDYKDSSTLILDNKYDRALEFIENKKYDLADSLLISLDDFKDSETLLYERALTLIEAKQYKKAYNLLTHLDDFKDSRELLLPVTYQYALSNAEQGNYSKASTLFKELGDYRDSLDQLLLADFYKRYEIGSIVNFGLYEQDNNQNNGKEEIEWLVLAKEDNQVLLISKCAIERMPYHQSDVSVTWETSTIRRWLNGTFINTAFNNTQKTNISTTTLKNLNDPINGASEGNTTTDKIFLLSEAELKKYIKIQSERVAIYTAYASVGGYEHICDWWLRTPGIVNATTKACTVSGYCENNNNFPSTRKLGVRPALWIDIFSLDS